MNVGDLLDAAFKLYRRHFLTFVGIAALLQVPMAILLTAVQFLLGGISSRFMDLSGDPAAISRSLTQTLALSGLSSVLALLQVLVVQNLISGALANAISRSYLGREVTILESYRFGTRRLMALIGASLLLFLVVLAVGGLLIGLPLGFLAAVAAGGDPQQAGLGVALFFCAFGLLVLFGLGALFLYARLILSTQTIVLEGQGPVAGLRRSWQLVGGSYWRVVLVAVLMWVISWIVSTITSLPLAAATFIITLRDPAQLPDSLAAVQVLSALASQIGYILVLPLQLSVFTLLYYDLRVRREGYDLELMAQQTAAA